VPIRIRHKVLFGELIVSYEATIVGPTTPMRRFAIKRSSRTAISVSDSGAAKTTSGQTRGCAERGPAGSQARIATRSVRRP
jgi:hypothetical protein